MKQDLIKEWLVIVNPNAGAGKCGHDWPLIEDLLNNSGISYHKVFTTRRLHAIVLARNNINAGYKKIIVVGGDGTLNEVINGIFVQKKFETSEITVGLIPVGTGNDWARMYGISNNYHEALKAILESKIFIQDAGKALFYKNNKLLHRYFINIAGVGFDELVTRKANKLKNKGFSNPAIYLLNIFTSLFGYKSLPATIEIDGVKKAKSIFSLSLGICKYDGGGMIRLPQADPGDGLFDLTVIRKIGKLDVLRNVKRLYDGTYIGHAKVESFRGEYVRVESAKRIYLEIDGENLGHTPIEFFMIPRSIKIIAGKEMY